MELIRLVVASVTGLLLAGGYLASISAYFSQQGPAYSERLDQSSVPLLALALLGATVILAFIPEKAVQEDEG